MNAVKLSEYTFPHEVRHRDVTGHIMLYAEKGRRRITFRFYDPGGERSKKNPVPQALGPAGSYPDPVPLLDQKGNEVCGGDGAVVMVRYIPELIIKWALKYLESKADERRKIERNREAASKRQNHVKIGYLFKRLRESAWYTELAERNRRRLQEVDRPMRWVESVLHPEFYLSEWNADTLKRLETARTQEGVRTTTLDGEPTFMQPCSRNTYTGDIRLLKQVFEEALEVPYSEGSEAWLLDVNPMTRVKRKMPKYGVRRKREAVDEHRYQLLHGVADEVDPTGRFRFFLILLRWTGRRVSTALRLTREVMLFTEEEIRSALQKQLCVYVLPHQIDRVAKLYAENGGAMFVRWWMVKGGQGGEAGTAEQFDAVHPVHPIVMEAAKEYFEGYWNKLGLGPDGPLFPSGEVITKPMSQEQVYSWFRRAARLLGDRGTPLGMTPDNAYHGLRYNRRTELFGVSVKYARWLCEHSVLSGTPGITVSEGVYQGLVPPELVRAVQMEAPLWDEE